MRFFFPGTRAIWQPFCLFSPKRQVQDTLKQHFMQPTSHEPRTRYRHHRSPYRSGQQCILMSREVEYRHTLRWTHQNKKCSSAYCQRAWLRKHWQISTQIWFCYLLLAATFYKRDGCPDSFLLACLHYK